MFEKKTQKLKNSKTLGSYLECTGHSSRCLHVVCLIELSQTSLENLKLIKQDLETVHPLTAGVFPETPGSLSHPPTAGVSPWSPGSALACCAHKICYQYFGRVRSGKMKESVSLTSAGSDHIFLSHCFWVGAMAEATALSSEEDPVAKSHAREFF
jgi:hypothetical protein